MAERHYLPKSCCLVFSVRTGATILAIMGIIGSGMNLASDSYGLAVIAPQIENYIDEYRIRSYEEFAGIQIYWDWCSMGVPNTGMRKNLTYYNSIQKSI